MRDLIDYIKNIITQKLDAEIIETFLQFNESDMMVTRYFKRSFYVVNVSIYYILFYLYDIATNNFLVR